MARSNQFASSLLRAALLGTTALALLGSPAAMARVGVTSATDGDPLGKPPQQNERVLRIGIDVQANEIITTRENDRAHLVFLDGTSLTVGPNAQLTIDKFVYDPASKTGDLAITASKGVFRLVGGKISKTKPITITTPSSTIGIRGGITLVNVQPSQTTSTFIFGNNMTVTGQGQTQNVTRPGSQVTTNAGTPPGPPTLAPPGALGGQMAQLEGRGSGQAGGSGGSGGQGSGGQGGQGGGAVPASFSQGNSGQGPGGLGPQGPGPNGPQNPANNPNSNNPPAANANDQRQTAGCNAQSQSGCTNATPDTTNNKSTSTSTTVIVSRGRYLADPLYTNFSSSDLSVTPTATNNTTLNSQATVTTKTTTQGNSTPTVGKTLTITTSDGRSITLDYQTDTLTNGFSVGNVNSPSFGQLKNGMGYVSSDDKFFVYIFDKGSDKVGFFGGTPTAVANFPTSGIGAYNLNDLGNSARLPFARETIGENSDLQNAKSQSKLYTAFSTGIAATIGQTVPDNRATAMQATISISGQGSSQKSYMGVFTGVFFRDRTDNGVTATDKGVFLSGAFNSTYRTDSSSQIGRQVSAISTADTGNGNAIYGEAGGGLGAAGIMVLTPDKVQATFNLDTGNLVTSVTTTRTSQASFDQPYNNLTGQDYYSVTSATKSTTGSVGQTRTTQTLNGFAGGLVEQRSSGGTFSTRAVTTDAPTDFTLGTNATTNRASATFTAQTWDTSTSATFKLGGLTGSSSGTSAFIDDNVYAVRDRPADTLSDTTTIAGSSTNVTSRTSMVSYNTAPVDSLFTNASVTKCTCEFLTWGWWGGDVSYGSSSTYNASGRDRVNLATYVAGTLTPSVNLPLTGTATYTGHMVGNVNNNGVSYIAAGSYQNAWNFANRNGVATITFDGTTFGGGTTANTFNTAGTVTFGTQGTPITSGNKSLTLNGAFFQNGTSNPAAGQAGNFAITNTTGNPYKAAGTFAAQK